MLLGGALTVAGSINIAASGSLDVSAASFAISVGANWTNNGAFNAQAGKVTFTQATGVIQVNGSTTWHDFTYDMPASGTTIQFQAGATQTISNAFPGSRFHVYSLAGAPLPLFPPPPPAQAKDVWLYSSIPLTYWNIILQPGSLIDLSYVEIDSSKAMTYDIPVQAHVYITNCLGWKNVNDIAADVTIDLDHNGKIDRILVTATFPLVRSLATFTGFTVQVPGYTLSPTGDFGTFYSWTTLPLQTQFYIMLKEQPYLDTGALPAWSVTANPFLVDSGTGTYYIPETPPASPLTDFAAPVLGYTLGVAGQEPDFRALLRVGLPHPHSHRTRARGFYFQPRSFAWHQRCRNHACNICWPGNFRSSTHAGQGPSAR